MTLDVCPFIHRLLDGLNEKEKKKYCIKMMCFIIYEYSIGWTIPIILHQTIKCYQTFIHAIITKCDEYKW